MECHQTADSLNYHKLHTIHFNLKYRILPKQSTYQRWTKNLTPLSVLPQVKTERTKVHGIHRLNQLLQVMKLSPLMIRTIGNISIPNNMREMWYPHLIFKAHPSISTQHMKSYARQFNFCPKSSNRFGMAVEVSSIQRQVKKRPLSNLLKNRWKLLKLFVPQPNLLSLKVRCFHKDKKDTFGCYDS